MKRIYFFVLLFTGFNLNAQSIRDTLFFVNGTMVIGELDRIKLGEVLFDPDDANDLTVQLRKLHHFTAATKIFRIETIRDEVYFGKILPADTAGRILIISGIDTINTLVTDISVLYPFKGSFRERFSGSASAGFNFTRSSDLGRLNFDTKLNYASKKNELSFTASFIYTIDDSTFSRDREDVNLKNNYYFSNTWFATVMVRYQKNLELGLDRRFQEGFGAGNKVITSKHVYAWVRTGLVFNQEKNTEDEGTGTLTEVFVQAEFNFFRFSNPEIDFIISESAYYGLSQSKRIRNDGQLDLSWEVIKDLDLTLSFYHNYDSQPPSAESRKFDYGVVFGIGFTF